MGCGLIDVGCYLNGWLAGIGHAAFAWVPDWLWALLPYWPILIVVSGLGLAYRFGGWPGVTAFVFGLGFFVGRKSVKTKPEPHNAAEHFPDGHPDPSPQKRPRLGSKERPIFGKW